VRCPLDLKSSLVVLVRENPLLTSRELAKLRKHLAPKGVKGRGKIIERENLKFTDIGALIAADRGRRSALGIAAV